jgi:hypothetical protein
MVFTMAVRDGWSRRSVLGMLGATAAGLVAGTVTGCSFGADDAGPPPPDPLEPLLAGTRELITRYGRSLTAAPDLAPLLDPLRRTHLAHEEALLTAIGRPELATPGTTSGSPASPGPAATGPPAATGRSEPTPEPDELRAEIRADLREAEQAAHDEAVRACLSAPPDRAALLGSIAAARATHAAVLA